MTHDHPNYETLRRALFDTLNDERTGMLGIQGASQHMQPMTHFFDEDVQTLWFISGKRTDLVRSLSSGGKLAHFTVTSGDRSVFSCMSGTLMQVNDPEKLDDLWSPAAAMWFDGGKDDLEVALLCMPLVDASVWTQHANALRFGIEMMRGSLGSHDPEVGEHAVLEFKQAA